MNWLDQLARKCAPTTAIVGGLVWIAYTLAALLQPWGNYATFVDQSGAVSNPSSFAFQLTALLGGAALLLLGAALAGTARRIGLPQRLPQRLPGQFGVALGLVGGAAGLAMWIGALLLQIDLAGAAMNVGAILIAIGAMLLAIDGAGRELATPLFIVGGLGMAAVFAAALVGLVAWMLPVYAALVMAVYGFAWVRFGDMLHNQ
jgi:hypothetical protein